MSAAPESALRLSTAFPGTRVLVVDDEQLLRKALSDVLSPIGYDVRSVGSGAEALSSLAQREFDVVLLDLKMPDLDGTYVLREAIALAPQTVFIILTAFASLDSAILGLRFGAFDYLKKPSSTTEIFRTIEAGLMKRRLRYDTNTNDPVVLLERALAGLKTVPQKPAKSDSESPWLLKTSTLLVDTHKRLVSAGGRALDLTPTEFEILVYLLRHRARVVSTVELVNHLRGFVLNEGEARNSLRSHIYRLRKKLSGVMGESERIETVRGQGYMYQDD